MFLGIWWRFKTWFNPVQPWAITYFPQFLYLKKKKKDLLGSLKLLKSMTKIYLQGQDILYFMLLLRRSKGQVETWNLLRDNIEFFIFFAFVTTYLRFILETESTRWGGTKEERENLKGRGDSPLSREPDVWLHSWPWDHDLSQNQESDT